MDKVKEVKISGQKVAAEVDSRVIEALEENKDIEVSVGLYWDDEACVDMTNINERVRFVDAFNAPYGKKEVTTDKVKEVKQNFLLLFPSRVAA